MAKATPEQTRKANRAAAITAVVVAFFAATFIGLVTYLDSVALDQHEKEVVIADQAPINPFYVLLIGSDTRKGTALYTGKATEHAQVDQHSDVMTLMRIDPREYTVSLLTIPRDTVITKGGNTINSALLEDDPEQVVEAVYELTGLRADYYMLTTFAMFSDLIDSIGGVTVDVLQDVTVDDPGTGGTITVKAGKKKTLKGSQALALARARLEYSDNQDAARQFNVREIEKAMIVRMLEGESISIEALMVVLENDVRTDMDLSVVGLTVLDFIDHANEVTIYAGTGPYEGGLRSSDEEWVVPNDADTWKKVMQTFKTGGDFSRIVKPPKIEPKPEPASSTSASSGSKSASSRASASASSARSAASSSSSASSSKGKR